jgi:ABC-2 type transport system permease protein
MSGAAVIAAAREALRRNRRAPLTWGLPLGGLAALIVAIYPSMADNLTTLAREYPEALREAFNVGDLSTPEEFLNAEMFSLIVPLAVGYFMIRSIVSALPAAEEAGELDVVLATPVERRELVAGAFLASLLTSAAVLLVVLALTLLASLIVDAGLGAGAALAGAAEVWPLGVFFGGVAALIAGLTGRAALVTALSGGILVAMYVFDLAGKMADDFSFLRHFSAFRLYGQAMVDGIDPPAFIGLALAGLLLAAVGAVAFERRDVAV